jgi:hypothetical protein
MDPVFRRLCHEQMTRSCGDIDGAGILAELFDETRATWWLASVAIAIGAAGWCGAGGTRLRPHRATGDS